MGSSKENLLARFKKFTRKEDVPKRTRRTIWYIAIPLMFAAAIAAFSEFAFWIFIAYWIALGVGMPIAIRRGYRSRAAQIRKMLGQDAQKELKDLKRSYRLLTALAFIVWATIAFINIGGTFLR